MITSRQPVMLRATLCMLALIFAHMPTHAASQTCTACSSMPNADPFLHRDTRGAQSLALFHGNAFDCIASSGTAQPLHLAFDAEPDSKHTDIFVRAAPLTAASDPCPREFVLRKGSDVLYVGVPRDDTYRVTFASQHGACFAHVHAAHTHHKQVALSACSGLSSFELWGHAVGIKHVAVRQGQSAVQAAHHVEWDFQNATLTDSAEAAPAHAYRVDASGDGSWFHGSETAFMAPQWFSGTGGHILRQNEYVEEGSLYADAEDSSVYYDDSVQDCLVSSTDVHEDGLICAPGEAWSFTANGCATCGEGLYSDAARITCEKCPVGTYSQNTGLASVDMCVACPSGKASNVEGATRPWTCLACAAGKYAGPGQHTCLDCPPAGAINASDPDFATCLQCPPGSVVVSSAGGSDSDATCQECPAGQYADPTQTACVPCPAGTYSGVLGATSVLACQDCPVDTYSPDAGAVSADSCFACEPGSYSRGGQSACAKCPLNSFVAPPGQPERCVFCVGGLLSATACMCLPGTEKIVQSAVVTCALCTEGFYSSANDSSTCTPCPHNASSPRNSSSLCDCAGACTTSTTPAPTTTTPVQSTTTTTPAPTTTTPASTTTTPAPTTTSTTPTAGTTTTPAPTTTATAAPVTTTTTPPPTTTTTPPPVTTTTPAPARDVVFDFTIPPGQNWTAASIQNYKESFVEYLNFALDVDVYTVDDIEIDLMNATETARRRLLQQEMVARVRIKAKTEVSAEQVEEELQETDNVNAFLQARGLSPMQTIMIIYMTPPPATLPPSVNVSSESSFGVIIAVVGVAVAGIFGAAYFFQDKRTKASNTQAETKFSLVPMYIVDDP